MRNSRVRITPKSDARSWSRREVLARGAGVASVLALPQLWIPKAWGQTATFDFYISTTGNDANPGTLAQPWALTSFIQGSANNNKMAGTRVGIIAGNYTITAAFPEHNTDYQYCKLNLPNGTATSSTYVASSDTNGNYSPRAATITWGGGTSTSNAMIGGGQNSNAAYIHIDGIRINANGVQCTTAGGGHIVQFYGNNLNANFRSESTSASGPGIIVENCELWNMDPQPTITGNYAAIAMVAVMAPIIRNNLIHDVLYTGSDSNIVSHIAGCMDLGCSNSHYLNNTIYNCPSGIWVKEGSTGTLCAYNYIYNCATTGTEQGGYCAAFLGFDGQGGNPNPGPAPTTQLIHHNVMDNCGVTHRFGNNYPQNSTIAVWAYNNTVYETTSNGVRGWDMAVTGDTAKFYNNIHVNAAGGSGAPGSVYAGKVNISRGQYTTVDYNAYYSTSASYNSWWQLVVNGVNTTNYNSLGSWQSATGAEAHSIASNPNFNFGSGHVTGRGANQFQLASGSPCLRTGLSGVNMGAWDGSTTQIGCSFAPGGAGSANPVPDAPSLTVS